MQRRKWIISLLAPLVFLTACGSLTPVESMDSTDTPTQEQSDNSDTSQNISSRYTTSIDSSGGKLLANIDAEVQADMSISYPIITSTVQPFTPEYIQKMVEGFYDNDEFTNLHVDYATMSLSELEETKEYLITKRTQIQDFCKSSPKKIEEHLKSNALDMIDFKVEYLDEYIQSYAKSDIESPCFDLLSRNVMAEGAQASYLDKTLHVNDTIGTAAFTGKYSGKTYNMRFERMGEFNNTMIVEQDLSETPILKDYSMEQCTLINYKSSSLHLNEDYLNMFSDQTELPDLEQSKKNCEQLLYQLGIEGMTYSYDSPMYIAAYPNEAVKDLGITVADSLTRCGRVLTYRRNTNQAPYRPIKSMYDNVIFTNSTNEFNNENFQDKDSQGYLGYIPNLNNCGPEKIDFYVTDLGLVRMVYSSPSVVTKTDENVTMLPLDDIILNASDALEHLSKTKSPQTISGKNYYDIATISLSMCEIRNPEFPDTKQIIPVWDFCNSDGLVIISFNAIDGTAIDRVAGY